MYQLRQIPSETQLKKDLQKRVLEEKADFGIA